MSGHETNHLTPTLSRPIATTKSVISGLSFLRGHRSSKSLHRDERIMPTGFKALCIGEYTGLVGAALFGLYELEDGELDVLI